MKKMKGAALAAAVAVFGLLTHAATAQEFPNKPIKVIVPFTGGNPFELEARSFFAFAEPRLKQPGIVESRPGGGSAIGIDAVVRSPADGYTLLWTGASLSQIKFLQKNLPFDPVKDLVPVSLVGEVATLVVINKAVPAKTWAEFVAYAKANPGKLNYGSAGRSSVMLATEALKAESGINLLEVPYGGSAAYTQALLQNQVQLAMSAASSVKQHIDSGDLRALMVIGNRKVPQMPDLPTSAELGIKSLRSFAWSGVLAPAGTPKAVVDKLAAEFAAYAKTEEAQKRATATIFTLVGSTPEEFRQVIETDSKAWEAVAKAINLQPE